MRKFVLGMRHQQLGKKELVHTMSYLYCFGRQKIIVGEQRLVYVSLIESGSIKELKTNILQL